LGGVEIFKGGIALGNLYSQISRSGRVTMLRDEARRGSELPGRCMVTVGREQGCGERGGCEPPSAPGWHSHTETQQHPEDPARPLSYR